MRAGLPIRLGRVEDGTDLVLDLTSPWHLAIQGMSRSGKSTVMYDLLAVLAPVRAVTVAGVDPTGILLYPWRDHPNSGWRSIGTRDMQAACEVLDELVAEMDRRITVLLDRALDKFDTFSDSLALVLVVLEEYPGILSAAEVQDQAEGRKPSDRLAPRIQRSTRRLIQEGAKVGFRVLLIAQRMDASIIGGAERSNLGTRITMRVDNADAIRMLHPNVGADYLASVPRMSPGVGLIEVPGVPIRLFKADLLEYRDYVETVRRSHG